MQVDAQFLNTDDYQIRITVTMNAGQWKVIWKHLQNDQEHRTGIGNEFAHNISCCIQTLNDKVTAPKLIG